MARYFYPGSFCPPTRGHVKVLEKSASIFPHVTVVCSTNSAKEKPWFSEKECQKMWHTYRLPKNVSVETFSSLSANMRLDDRIVMIRGIRNRSDYAAEKGVMFSNYERFGIENFHYVFSGKEHCHISSSKTRQLAENLELEKLHDYVSPMIISMLLEKVLSIGRVYLVVGKPGSGKSTLLRKLTREYSEIKHVNTDQFSDTLKPLIERSFPGENIVKLALQREDDLKKVLAVPWGNLLKEYLRQSVGSKMMLIEIPYAMQKDKLLFRWVGGRILHFGCDLQQSIGRVKGRGTPELLPFIKRIPGSRETVRIARANKLELIYLDTTDSIESSYQKLKKILNI